MSKTKVEYILKVLFVISLFTVLITAVVYSIIGIKEIPLFNESNKILYGKEAFNMELFSIIIHMAYFLKPLYALDEIWNYGDGFIKIVSTCMLYQLFFIIWCLVKLVKSIISNRQKDGVK